jgi:hypothetical protein
MGTYLGPLYKFPRLRRAYQEVRNKARIAKQTSDLQGLLPHNDGCRCGSKRFPSVSTDLNRLHMQRLLAPSLHQELLICCGSSSAVCATGYKAGTLPALNFVGPSSYRPRVTRASR